MVMKNLPCFICIDVFPIQILIYRGFPIAMFDYGKILWNSFTLNMAQMLLLEASLMLWYFRVKIDWNLDENARGWASLKNVDQHMFLQISIQKVWSNVRLWFQRKSHCIKCLCPAPLNLHCSMFEHHSLQMQICRSILSVTRICRPFILSGPFLVIAGEVGNCLRCA